MFVRMAWISFGTLPWRVGGGMTPRVSMLLKSRASLTCFRACFLPGRAKDLSAPRYGCSMIRKLVWNRWILLDTCGFRSGFRLPIHYWSNLYTSQKMQWVFQTAQPREELNYRPLPKRMHLTCTAWVHSLKIHEDGRGKTYRSCQKHKYHYMALFPLVPIR